MIKKHVNLLIVLMISLVFVMGCSSSDKTEPVDNVNKELDTTIVEEKLMEVKPKETAEEAYERILLEYTTKIKEATPGFIEEYKDEAKDNIGGLEGLAEIAMGKVMELAEIQAEGVQEMAEVMMTKGSGKYDEYEKWGLKLYDIYSEEGEKIMDVYMKSAM